MLRRHERSLRATEPGRRAFRHAWWFPERGGGHGTQQSFTVEFPNSLRLIVSTDVMSVLTIRSSNRRNYLFGHADLAE